MTRVGDCYRRIAGGRLLQRKQPQKNRDRKHWPKNMGGKKEKLLEMRTNIDKLRKSQQLNLEEPLGSLILLMCTESRT